MTDDAPVPTTAYDRSAEVRAILDADDSLMGRVHRYLESGKSPAEIAQLEGNQGPAFVYNYRLEIGALLEGEVPSSAWVARAVAAKLRTWLRTLDLSGALREDLVRLESTCRSRAEDREAQGREIDAAVARTAQAEQTTGPGHLRLHAAALPQPPHRRRDRQDSAEGRALRPRRLLPRRIRRPVDRPSRRPHPAPGLPLAGVGATGA